MNNKILMKSLREIEPEKSTPVIKIAETVTNIVRENYYEDEVEVAPETPETFGRFEMTMDEFREVCALAGMLPLFMSDDRPEGATFVFEKNKGIEVFYEVLEDDYLEEMDGKALAAFIEMFKIKPDGIYGVTWMHEESWEHLDTFTIADYIIDNDVDEYLAKVRGIDYDTMYDSYEQVDNTKEVYKAADLIEQFSPVNDDLEWANESYKEDEPKQFTARVKVVVLVDIPVEAANADDAYDIADKQVDNARTLDEIVELGQVNETNIVSVKIVKD